jgi:hypothetical protein
VFTEGIGVLTESIGVFIVCICGRSSCLIICCYFRLSLCSTGNISKRSVSKKKITLT